MNKEIEQRLLQPLTQINLQLWLEVIFPSPNRLNCIKEYEKQLAQRSFSPETTCLQELILLSKTDYDYFVTHFLNSQPWLKGKGGSASSYISSHNNLEDMLDDPQELKRWQAQSYLVALLVSDGNRSVIVNPEGYTYARYVGFQSQNLPVKVESKENNLIDLNQFQQDLLD